MLVLGILMTMLLSVIISYFFGFAFGRKGVFFISIFSMGVCCLYSTYLFINMLLANKVQTTYITL
jgi:hypothetical protein